MVCGVDEVQKKTTELVTDKAMSMEDFMASGDDDQQRGEAVLQELCNTLWLEKAKLLFGEIDKNEDGQLSNEEYCSWVCNNTDRAKLFIPTLDTASSETIQATANESWTLTDLDGNGSLSAEEFEKGYVAGMTQCYTDNATRA